MADPRDAASGDTNTPRVKARSAKRKNTSKACEECRRRRTKCDGQRPSCSRCLSRIVSCQYTDEEDGRRPAPRSYVILLRDRIEKLEQILKAHGIDAEESMANLEAAPGSSSARSRLTTSLEATAADTMPDNEDLIAAFEGALSLDETLNFDNDGAAHYFGPTSGRLEFQSLGSESQHIDDDASNDSVDDISNLESSSFLQNLLPNVANDGIPISNELKYHLIDLYFTYHQPWCQVVNERLFRESERTGGRYCSPLLLNCILFIGARLSHRLEVRTKPEDPNTAGRLFWEKAEALLHNDLKWPSITTIQALSIMCTGYVSLSADAAGWLHQGMANRLALDMGLNLDPATLAKSGQISAEEIELRREVYWALYCDDKLSASYTGRVCTMLHSQGIVQMPSVPPLKLDEDPDTQDEVRSTWPRRDMVLLHTGLIGVSRIIEKILLNLYAPRPLARGPQRMSFLDSCLLELRNWFYDLPPEMRIDRPAEGKRVPAIYTMHMVYYTAFILLVKPFFRKTRGSNETSTDPSKLYENDCLSQYARSTCYRAAKEICLTAKRYRQAFGSFRQSPITAMHCSHTASIVLLPLEGTSTERVNSSGDANLQTLMKVLEELSDTWNPAGRIRSSIMKLHMQLQASSRTQNESDTRNKDNPSETQPHCAVSPMASSSGNTGYNVDFLTQPMFSWSEPSNSASSFLPDLGPRSQGDITLEAEMGGFGLSLPFWTSSSVELGADPLPGDYGTFESLNRDHLDHLW